MDYRLDKILKNTNNLGFNNSVFDYQPFPINVIAAFGNILYGKDSAIKISQDYGETWQVISGVPLFSTMHITNTYVVYGFSRSGGTTKLHKSTDLVTFTEVDLTSFGNISDIRPYGFDSNGATFAFAEKNSSSSPEVPTARIFTTTNSGVSFSVSLTVGVDPADSTKIGHFHNVNYLGGATRYGEPETWVATTGDHNHNTKWFISTDNAVSWTEIPDISGQKYRTLYIDRLADNYVIWSTDAIPGQLNGIYKGKLDDLKNTTELVFPISQTSFGSRIGFAGKGLCVTVREGSTKVGTVTVFASRDAGRTWQADKDFAIRSRPVNHDQPGFQEIVGPDGMGNYYLQGIALKDAKSIRVTNKDIYIG